jgi:hypothetical protein
MIPGLFRIRFRKTPRQPDLPDMLSDVRRTARTVPCELWTEFGVAHIADVKLERPSALVTLVMQKARV